MANDCTPFLVKPTYLPTQGLPEQVQVSKGKKYSM